MLGAMEGQCRGAMRIQELEAESQLLGRSFHRWLDIEDPGENHVAIARRW